MRKFCYLYQYWDDAELKVLKATSWEEVEEELFQMYKDDREYQPSYIEVSEVKEMRNIHLTPRWKKYKEELETLKFEKRKEDDFKKLHELALKYGKKVV